MVACCVARPLSSSGKRRGELTNHKAGLVREVSPPGLRTPGAREDHRATVLHTRDPSTATMRRLEHAPSDKTIRLSKAEWAANAPSEERHTVALSTNSLFVGVWDGHGGSGGAAENVHQHFSRALDERRDSAEAFEETYVSRRDVHLDCRKDGQSSR